MRLIQTFVWMVFTAILVSFIAMNWTKAPVNFWPLSDGSYLHFNWPVGFTAFIFFLLGMVPMWLLSKAGRWRMKRQISTLQNAAQISAAPSLSSDSLAQAVPENPAN